MRPIIINSTNKGQLNAAACKSTVRRNVKTAVQLPGAVEKAVAKSAGGPIILDGTVSK